MGEGYSILVWDDFGSGGIKIGARLLASGVDIYGHPQNWWPSDADMTADKIAELHDLDGKYEYWRIIFDNVHRHR